MTFWIQKQETHPHTTEIASITTFSLHVSLSALVLIIALHFLVLCTYFLNNGVDFSMINATPY
jgi:hypothetical protein